MQAGGGVELGATEVILILTVFYAIYFSREDTTAINGMEVLNLDKYIGIDMKITFGELITILPSLGTY